MLAVVCASVWVAGVCQLVQDPRWWLIRAAARYDTLLVKPPPGAPPDARHKAKFVAGLVGHLQQEAHLIWRRGLRGGDPEQDAMAIHNMLLSHKQIVTAVGAHDYPVGMLESYWIQVGLLDKLKPVCAEVAKNPVSPWARQLPAYLEATRHLLRTAYRPILELMQ